MFSSLSDLTKIIRAAKDEFSHVQAEYEENRKYYENLQAPTDESGVSLVPKETSYIIVNRCKPHANLQIAKEVGGKIDKTLKSDDPILVPVEKLLDNVLEKNKFKEIQQLKLSNYRNVEGMGCIKFVFDPFTDGEYGLGFPEIHISQCMNGELLLDPNSPDGYHEHDKVRIFRKRITLRDALRNPEWKHKHEEIKASTNQEKHEDRRHCDLYEVEFIDEFLVPGFINPATGKAEPVGEFVSAQDEDFENRIGEREEENEAETGDFAFSGESFVGKFDQAREIVDNEGEFLDMPDNEFLFQKLPLIKVRLYFMCKVINEDVMVEPPKPTGYSGFTIIPSLHTPRNYNHKYPASDLMYLRQEQDKINMLNSMSLEIVKKGLKNPHFFSGVDGKDEQAFLQRNIAGIGEFFFLRDPAARYFQPTAPTMPAHLLQELELSRQNFDDIGNTNEPDRGQPQKLSGVAIQSLQARADIPAFVPTTHLANSFTELFRRILETIQQKMTNPFYITSEIEGKKRRIPFNMPKEAALSLLGDMPDDDELFVISRDMGNEEVVNDLSTMNVPEIDVDIDTNTLQKENAEIEKALLMFQNQQLHPQDLHKVMYPHKWAQTMQRALEWNQAFAITQQITQLSPEGQQRVLEEVQQEALVDQTLSGNNGRAT